MSHNYKKIAFQGVSGAYSDLACRSVFPELETIACDSFEDAFNAVQGGKADLAMIPVDNTIAGRVADVHHLMPGEDVYIIGEHFQPIEHYLLGIKGAQTADLVHVHSHVHALPQCRKIIKRLGLKPHIHDNTAMAAQDVAETQDKTHGAIASKLAAELYDLEILAEHVHDEQHNTTRFLILAKEPLMPEENTDVISSLIFQVRNIPAALYKALGGFASNSISLTKLESYVDENFQAAQFYCEVEGHPNSEAFKHAIEELSFYAKDVRVLGTYPMHPFRKK